MSSEPITPAERPTWYVYRGKTITNNGEKTALVKHNTLEALIKCGDLEQSGAFLAEIKPFFDPKRPQKLYTVEAYLEVLDRVCDWLFPQLSREEGREEVGRLLLASIRKTIFGRVALATLSMIGPDRLAKIGPRLFDDVAGIGKRTVTQLGPGRYIFASRNVSGTYEEEVGVIKAGLTESGARNVRCTVTIHTPSSWDYLFEWD